MASPLDFLCQLSNRLILHVKLPLVALVEIAVKINYQKNELGAPIFNLGYCFRCIHP